MNNIKNITKDNLKYIWPKALAAGGVIITAYALSMVLDSVLFISLGVNSIGNAVIQLFNIVFYTFILNPLLFGVYYWFYYSLPGNNVSLSKCFYFFNSFKNYKRAINLSILTIIRTIGVQYVFSLPATILLNNGGLYASNSTYPEYLAYFFSLLSIAGTVLMIIQSLRYFAAPILLINDPSITAREALYLARAVSEYRKGHLFGFVMSFFGWFLLCILALPIIFVVPYYIACYCNKCRYMLYDYNRNVAMKNQGYYQQFYNAAR